MRDIIILGSASKITFGNTPGKYYEWYPAPRPAIREDYPDF